MVIERHESPDETLSLVVLREGGDLTVGFEAGPSHTHGDVLVGEYASIGEDVASPEAAVRRYVSDILNDRMKIIISRVGGTVRDISALPYDRPDFDKYLEPGETVEVRYWHRHSSDDV